jgi:hypothetical protein
MNNGSQLYFIMVSRRKKGLDSSGVDSYRISEGINF